MLIENIIGICGFDSDAGSLVWNPGISEGKLGIRNLNFNGGKVDLIRENAQIRIRCDHQLTVYYQNQKLECTAGENVFSVPSITK